MKLKENNFAYIDGANLHKGIAGLGWVLDYARFRVWLSEKYAIKVAYIFIGLIPKYKDLYTFLNKVGYTLVFKEVIYDDNGKPKGNCDADLVLQAVRDVYESRMQSAVIVASDGDYAGLVKFLQEKRKIETVLSPANEKKCSILLKRMGVKISYLGDQKNILMSQKEKAPNGDGTP
ncbi:MAG: NYN domain-containing protein [Candidatus Harrisonbacteria bacterium]|nr:NYN domain-containing protein [Candidatus Harrisonbacteria bacterium]